MMLVKLRTQCPVPGKKTQYMLITTVIIFKHSIGLVRYNIKGREQRGKNSGSNCESKTGRGRTGERPHFGKRK